jgi:hypothetical protein
MSDTELTPQIPGEPPGTNPDDLAPLLELPLVDLVAGLPVMTDAELVALDALERNGEARENVLQAISDAQMARVTAAQGADDADPLPVADPAAEPIELPTPAAQGAVTGDERSYAKRHAHEIDQATLTRPVLTLDGWLLPRPRAEGQG